MAGCLHPGSSLFLEVSPIIPACLGNHPGIPCVLLISPLSLHSTFQLPPAPVLRAVALGPKGCFPELFSKKSQQLNSLQNNHFLADTEGTWGFMSRVAQRGIRAGSGRRCQHSRCQSPGERSPEGLASAGMRGSSAKAQRTLPTLIRTLPWKQRELRGELCLIPCRTSTQKHQESWEGLGRGWLLRAGFSPSKSIPMPPESEGGGPCHRIQLLWELVGKELTKPDWQRCSSPTPSKRQVQAGPS